MRAADRDKGVSGGSKQPVGTGSGVGREDRGGEEGFQDKEFLYHFYEGATPGSWSMGELYNYDEATRDARSCGTTARLCGIEKVIITHDKPLAPLSEGSCRRRRLRGVLGKATIHQLDWLVLLQPHAFAIPEEICIITQVAKSDA